ncbi:MAG: purine-nucleoside phosphorylase [Lachnospiraceae bacterium]|nr:purine-nucleoside phosphorylase [Lachnospiraceae bacterium]
MALYPTPHINAKPEDFARTVLMPGDPLRSKFIAENFLDNPVLVNNVRGVNGYTGTFEGARVTVMASGMGIPSIGIYSYELFNFFGVENIIRIGSAGALDLGIHIRDIVFGMGACTNSNYADQFHLAGTFAPICNYDLLRTAVGIADEMKLNYHVGNLLSSDPFYGDDKGLPEALNGNANWAKMGVMAVEMEAAGLYMNAARANKPDAPRRALALCTISDHIITGEATTAEERQNTFTDMMKIALRTAKEFDHE